MLRDVWSFNTETNTWKVIAYMPVGLASHDMVGITYDSRDYLLITGGILFGKKDHIFITDFSNIKNIKLFCKTKPTTEFF